jgi:hypothetical protein
VAPIILKRLLLLTPLVALIKISFHLALTATGEVYKYERARWWIINNEEK